MRNTATKFADYWSNSKGVTTIFRISTGDRHLPCLQLCISIVTNMFQIEVALILDDRSNSK